MALRNIEIFEREGVLENVREHEGYLGDRLRELQDRLPIVGDVRGAGFFWALELVRDEADTRFERRRARGAAARLPHRPAARGGPDRPPRRPRRRRAAPGPAAGLHARASSTRWSRRPRRSWPTPRSASSAARDPHRPRVVAGGGRPGRPRRALRGDVSAPTSWSIGGGYAGPVDRVAAARARRLAWRCSRPSVCGHGPSGRNGGFCETLWSNLPDLVERFGPERALAAAARLLGERARRSAPGARRRASTRGSARAASCSPPPPRRRTPCSTGSSGGWTPAWPGAAGARR